MITKKEKRAFTLAETLTTLLVIGVVAALTIPALMQQIGDYTLQKQKDVFSKKWAEGLRLMRVDGKLETKYSSTGEFVNELRKYFKIQAVCDSNNLTGCFAETITSYENGEAEEFEVKDLKSAKNFNKSEEDSDVYGIKFSDGTSMLLAYRKGCSGIAEGDTRGNHTACLLYVYDVNANKSPNAYGGNTGATAKDGDNDMSDDKRNQINKGRDMVGNASITKGNAYGLGFEIINNTAFSPGACTGPNNDICYTPSGSNDYWQGATNFCSALGGHLPTNSELREISQKIYESCNNSNSTGYYDGCDYDTITSSPLFNLIGGGDNWILTFSSESCDEINGQSNYPHGYVVWGFEPSYSGCSGYSGYGQWNDAQILCIK